MSDVDLAPPARSTPPAAEPARRSLGSRTVSVGPLPAALLLLVLVGTATTSGFATVDNIRAILTAASITGIVAVCMTFLTLSGNFVSLGVQQNTVLAAILFLSLTAAGAPLVLAVGVPLVVLVVIAVVQGVVVARGMNTVITTLAVGAILFGAMSSVTGGQVITTGGRSVGVLGQSLLFGVPVVVYGLVVVTAVAWLIATRTSVGRRCLLLGASRPTAVLSGVSITRTTVFAFVVLAVGATIAGVLTAAQLGQATANDLSTLTIDVVAAVLVGGTAMAGGSGSPVRSAAGALLIALLNNLMVLNGFTTGWRLAVQGALVVVVVLAVQRFSRAAR
ncbi:ABC transporter permease [Pseudonocardia sp. RS010]|uniref:ABC transporter permease n=1 Tax=Pseudonocardia sp. RS010 TaxID=3385979 RepID=UPI00399EEA3D